MARRLAGELKGRGSYVVAASTDAGLSWAFSADFLACFATMSASVVGFSRGLRSRPKLSVARLVRRRARLMNAL